MAPWCALLCNSPVVEKKTNSNLSVAANCSKQKTLASIVKRPLCRPTTVYCAVYVAMYTVGVRMLDCTA